jgi:hypothetical protein
LSVRHDWRIGKRGRACAACTETFPEGQSFHCAIWREGEGFRRRDLCAPCFAAEAEPPYSHWMTRLPESSPNRPRAFDLALAARFLRRLAAEEGGERAALTHLLAILLVRKRAVRIVDLPMDATGPRVRIDFPTGEESIQIPAPPLLEGDVSALRDQLTALLDLGLPE